MPRLHQLEGADVAIVAFGGAAIRQADDIHAGSLPHFNESLDFQHDEGFAQEGAADVKLFGKVTLGGHFVADGEVAVANHLPQFGGNFGVTAADAEGRIHGGCSCMVGERG